MRERRSKRANRRGRILTGLGLILSLAIGDTAFAGGHGPAPEPADADSELFSDAKIRSVELGEYRVRTYYPVDAQKSTVRFVLHAAVASENFADARHVLENRRYKLRDEVIIVTRMTPLIVFDEAELTTFRRRILLRLRRSLPELLIDDIYVSDFELSVKSL